MNEVEELNEINFHRALQNASPSWLDASVTARVLHRGVQVPYLWPDFRGPFRYEILEARLWYRVFLSLRRLWRGS